MEDELKRLSVHCEKGLNWDSHVVEDGNLVARQNPASSENAADALLAKPG